MTTLIAFLRGINVGGHNKVPMAELRDLAGSIGLANPSTYIQSGNLVFESAHDHEEVRARLESALESHFGFEIPVVLRTRADLDRVAQSHPFLSLGLTDSHLMVAFLGREPEAVAREALDTAEFEPDSFVLAGREVFLAYPNGSGRSKLSQSLLERRLGVTVTIRNRRTVLRLIEMSNPVNRP